VLGWRWGPAADPTPASAALISGWIVLSVLAFVDLAGEQGGGAGFRLIPWGLVAFDFATATSEVRSAARGRQPPLKRQK
jgi:hypothetical protein